MNLAVRKLTAAIPMLLLFACTRQAPPVAHAASVATTSASREEAPRARREVRVTGILEAVHSAKVLVPQIYGQGGAMTLTKLIPNGSRVKDGDLIAVFESTQQADKAREAL